MHCPSCKFENPEGKKFCEECGAVLVRTCPSCGAEVRPSAKFCGDCGTPLAALEQRPAAKRRTGKDTPRARKTPQRTVSPTTVPSRPPPAEAERWQLTVTFIDLVGSTQLSAQLDPEDYRAVVQDYQQTCVAVLQRHGGYLAQSLGDGLLVYFGYPAAHEDDARRAVRTGLEIVEALCGQVRPHALPVRIGIHTGLVVIGEIGVRGRTEQLALGETPNIAARLQGLAEPNTVLISATTHRLIEGYFESQPFGSHLLKGLDTPMAVYQVQSERQSVSPLAGKITLTPLIGREQEVGLLIDRWEQAKESRGQVVLLSGEPGIGKSRLAYTLREHVTKDGSLLFEARCSPYHQHSALYPPIEVLQRTLVFARQDRDEEKVQKLERALALYNLQESLPLFTALLSLPTPAQYPTLTLTPQKQKERTLQALLQLLIAQAERQATVSVWEDLHWADPSSLEFLSLLIEQIPTTKLLLVLTFRPEFTPPWKPRSHLSQLVLNRLGKKQVEAMIEQAAAGKDLPPDVIGQIVIKTDGVPLFVEELTKSVIESVGSMGSPYHTPLQLAIPATLQEALLARLDRLSTARQVAQLGATLGREFSYELLQAVASVSVADLQTSLSQLVEAEILYQRGIGAQAHYFFKHALIQDTAYQSLLKSTRQQYHRQIAHVLEERFSDTKENQPELLAHHYTEAGLLAQAIPYWQQAGERAFQQSAYVEAISHLSKGLELLTSLPATSERTQQELWLLVILGPALISGKGYGAPEVEHTYTRAYEVCQQSDRPHERMGVLPGLWAVCLTRGEVYKARDLAEQYFLLAQRVSTPAALMFAHGMLGDSLLNMGELTAAHEHFVQSWELYNPQEHNPRVIPSWGDPGVASLSSIALILGLLGYPAQAQQRLEESLALAERLAHPFSLAFVLTRACVFHSLFQEWRRAKDRAEEVMTLATEQGLPFWLVEGRVMHGQALVGLGQVEEGLAQMQQGLTFFQSTGTEQARIGHSPALAIAYARGGRVEEGLAVLAEALAFANNTGMHVNNGALYVLKGWLLLARSREHQAEAETCFRQAIDITRLQSAKSLELLAVMSLSRLWRKQGKKKEAHAMLAEIYNWFTEGFDTKDLQEAKVLLGELSSP